MSSSAFLLHFCCCLFLLSSVQALNDATVSNYFIGQFTLGGLVPPVNQPYPLDMCVQIGLFSNYAYFECDNETSTTVTMTTFGASDPECLGDELSEPIIYGLEDAVTAQGALYDFNCIGITNVVTYDIFLGGCDTAPVGTANIVTDLCVQYANHSNIANELYPDIPDGEYYQLSQRYTCTNTSATVQTFIGEECAITAEYPSPLDEYTALTDCGFFFSERSFVVYGEMLSCIQSGAPTFTSPPTTTTEADSSTVACVQAMLIALHLAMCMLC